MIRFDTNLVPLDEIANNLDPVHQKGGRFKHISSMYTKNRRAPKRLFKQMTPDELGNLPPASQAQLARSGKYTINYKRGLGACTVCRGNFKGNLSRHKKSKRH